MLKGNSRKTEFSKNAIKPEDSQTAFEVTENQKDIPSLNGGVGGLQREKKNKKEEENLKIFDIKWPSARQKGRRERLKYLMKY